jgi:hypothetical protein
VAIKVIDKLRFPTKQEAQLKTEVAILQVCKTNKTFPISFFLRILMSMGPKIELTTITPECWFPTFITSLSK